MNHTKPKYRNIIFDAGNVIVDLDIPKAEAMFQKLMGVTFLDAKDEDLQTFLDYEVGAISTDRFIEYFVDRAPGHIQAPDVVQAWTSMLIDIPQHRLNMLNDLKRAYRVYILSNTNAMHIEWVAKFLKENNRGSSLDQFVHRAFYSHEMGSRKPKEEIYLKMMEMENMIPEECIFFDDLKANISTASALGLTGILVDPKKEIADLVKLYF